MKKDKVIEFPKDRIVNNVDVEKPKGFHQERIDKLIYELSHEIERAYLEEDYYSLVDSCQCYTLKNYNYKIYVAEESESIFEPKGGDMGSVIGLEDTGRFVGDLWMIRGAVMDHFFSGELTEIIMRDNKHFMDAKIEQKIKQ